MKTTKTRHVTTRSGAVFTVPAGISRNHGIGAWVVTWGKLDWKPKAFGAVGDAQALAAAKRELARRKAIALERGDVPSMDRAERRSKTMTFGRPGINFKLESRRCGYFTVRVEHYGRRKVLYFAVHFGRPDYREQVGRRWRVAIAVRDLLGELIARDQWKTIRAIRARHLPAEVAVRAELLDIPASAVTRLAGALLRRRNELT